MEYLIPPGFEGNYKSKVFATDLLADILNEERWEVDEISDKIIKRILSRKSTRPIDIETERELFLRYRRGELMARDELVFANLRLVYSIARRFRPHKLTCNDIFAEGCFGLLKAIDGYGIESVNRFASYAYKTIYYHIYNFLNRYNSAISYPQTLLSLRSKYRNFYDRFIQEYQCCPSDSYIAEVLDINLSVARGLRECCSEPLSVDHLCDLLSLDFIRNDLIDEIIDLKPDNIDASLYSQSLYGDIMASLNNLSNRESDIIRKSFGIGCAIMTLKEIGFKYDITKERVRQIREKAIKKLKGKYGFPLRQYL